LDLVNCNGAVLLEEKDLKDKVLYEKVNSIINDDKKLKTMRNNLSGVSILNSATLIYENIRKLVNGD